MECDEKSLREMLASPHGRMIGLRNIERAPFTDLPLHQRFYRRLGILVLFAFVATARGEVRFGFDARSSEQISFLQINGATSDACVTTVADSGRGGLKKVKSALIRLGSGPNQGKSLSLKVNKAGVITRIGAGDGSRIDLLWNRSKAYREVSVVLRDTKGRKVGFAQNITTTQQTSILATTAGEDETPATVSFGGSPETYISWDTLGGHITREQLTDGSVIPEETGKIMAGMIDQSLLVINTLIDRMGKIPKLVLSGGNLNLLVTKVLADTVIAAAGLRDVALKYFGDLVETMLNRWKGRLERLLADVPTADEIISDALSQPAPTSFAPTPIAHGTARILSPPANVREGDTLLLTIVREGGNAGILSGQISIIGSANTSTGDVRFKGTAYYYFADGDTDPKVVRIVVRRDTNFGEGSESLVLEHDGGGDAIQQVAIGIQDAPPLNAKFHLVGNSGAAGLTLGTATGCSLSSAVRLYGPVECVLDYNPETGRGEMRISAPLFLPTFGTTFTEVWKGSVAWNGSELAGVLKSSQPSMSIKIAWTQTGEFRATGTVPIGVYLWYTDGSCTGPRNSFYYPITNLLMSP